MSIRALDLFCGAGGSSLGARAAGGSIVCGIDECALATSTFAANFPNALAINATLSERSGVKLLGAIGKIDLILASPECTNHTCARGGKPRDEESRRSARYVLRFAQELKPRWIVLENVIQMRSWSGYDPLIDELRKLGYFVRPQILDAASFGVPQTRRRLFLLCDRERPPDPVSAPGEPIRPGCEILDPEGVWRSTPLHNGRRARATLERAQRAIRELGRGRPFLVVYYGSDGAGGWHSLDRPIRTLTTLDRFGLVTWRGDTPMLRMLQVPELRRAMGFDDNFRIDMGTRRDRIRLLGNAVCPPVMDAVIRSLTRKDHALASDRREEPSSCPRADRVSVHLVTPDSRFACTSKISGQKNLGLNP
jgi:DNA (cytosine-5)-methyltransferase 1